VADGKIDRQPFSPVFGKQSVCHCEFATANAAISNENPKDVQTKVFRSCIASFKKSPEQKRVCWPCKNRFSEMARTHNKHAPAQCETGRVVIEPKQTTKIIARAQTEKGGRTSP
jgi:hypothetical protein